MARQAEQNQQRYRAREAARRRHAKAMDDAFALLQEARRTSRGDTARMAQAADEALATWNESAAKLIQADALKPWHK